MKVSNPPPYKTLHIYCSVSKPIFVDIKRNYKLFCNNSIPLDVVNCILGRLFAIAVFTAV